MASSTDGYNLKKVAKIGNGNYGIVYKVQTADGKDEYAFKRNMVIKGNPSKVVRELDILQRLRSHPRIIAILMVSLGSPFSEIPSPIKDADSKYTFEDDVWHFLFELAETDLFRWISQTIPTFAQTKQFMLDILLGVEFMHRSSIMHRDLKTQNIVVFKPGADPVMKSDTTPSFGISTPFDGTTFPRSPKDFDETGIYRAKICDFGLAKPFIRDGLSTRNVTTLYYRAPEIAGQHRDYDYKSDCWSVGCIFYELLFRMTFVGQINTTITDLQLAIINNLPYIASDHEKKEILGYKAPHRQPARVTSVSERILQNATITTLIRNEGLDVNVTAMQLGSLITRLLTIDPTQRLSATDALNDQFFNSHRDYIEKCRLRYPPKPSIQFPYDIPKCFERSQVFQSVIAIYNTGISDQKPFWYSHKRLLHAIDLFDRCLRYFLRKAGTDAIETEQHGKAMNALKSQLYFYACLYLSVKYFSSIDISTTLRDILPQELQTQKNAQKIEKYEIELMRDILDYSVYRHTLYEAVCLVTTDRKVEFEMLIQNGLIKILTGEINGLTPTTLAEQVYVERNTAK
jgi:cyclin-dependent kinase 12/13